MFSLTDAGINEAMVTHENAYTLFQTKGAKKKGAASSFGDQLGTMEQNLKIDSG